MPKASWAEIKKKYKIYSTRKYNQIKRIYATPQAFEDAVIANPYEMVLNFLEKNFKLGDELVLSICPELRCSAERCKWVCREIIKKAESDGNTRMSAYTLAQNLHSGYPDLTQFVVNAVNTEMFYYDATSKWVSLIETYNNEVRIANEILNRVNNPIKEDMNWQKYKDADNMSLTDEQLSLLETVCNESIVMLNGSAGTGKSATTRALINMLDDNGKTYTMLAPTGIAAKRLREATNRDAKTIHMHMACHDSIGDYLIIDEMSMVGVGLLGWLFSDLPKKTKIVLICDEAQLASISCGNIVQDIISSGIVPTVRLTRVFRYGTNGIATIATDIRMGNPINEEAEFDDYSYIPIGSTTEFKHIISPLYKQLVGKYGKDGVMILSPFNVRSFGTFAVNDMIQSAIGNTDPCFSYKRQSTDINFCVGDRIINTENNYHMMSDNFSTIAVMNGDVGTVLNYDGEYMTVQYDNGVAYLEKGDIYKQLLAYCISVHKSQGTQAKAVVVIADSSHSFFLTRNLLYVAASRAQEELIIIGDIDTINAAMKIQQEKRRDTWLKEMLIAENKS